MTCIWMGATLYCSPVPSLPFPSYTREQINNIYPCAAYGPTSKKCIDSIGAAHDRALRYEPEYLKR